MMKNFFYIREIVHKEFVPPGQSVNETFYCEILKRLRENVRRKRPELWKKKDWFLHHNNAPAHTSLLVKAYLAKNRMATVPVLPILLTWPPATSTSSLK